MEPVRIGPYLLGAELGSGGMGKVYRAEVVGKASGLLPGQQVALKIIHPHLLESPGFFKRFLREAGIGKSVRHPNVVRCFDCDAVLHEGRQLNFLVMEYVEGETLRALLRELERVPEQLCRHLGREVARALSAIHEAGVIHRDLKPENVLITREHAVKVMDLGVARVIDETLQLSDTGAFIGTLEYAAPEQFRADGREIDGRADLYALGIMLYELSTGRNPYRDSDVRKVLKRVLEETPRKAGEINTQLSPFFEEVVAKLMAKDREDRFASATDLVEILVQGEKSEWWKARAQAIRLETKRPLRRIRIPRETAVYGRDEELARLQQIYECARNGQGRVLLIEGEAGIGKTRLVDEFVGRLHAAGEDLNFLFGSYPPGGAATASGAWSTAYREHFGSERLEERLKDYLTITPALIPAFAALLKGEPPPQGKESLTKDSVLTAFVHATRALAAERMTIVLIEDLHFAPEDGRAMFASLALAVPEHPILLIGTARPELPETWRSNIERLEQTGTMALPRLGPKDLTKLLVDAFRSESLAQELSYRIAAKSDGNPFFVFEIIRGLREGQFITQKPDGSWVTSKRIEHIQVPSSVLDLVKARVSGLSEEARDLLDLASCCGFEFDPLVVAEAGGIAHLPVLKHLAQIERQHRLVRASGSKYVFDHHQVQEALYGSLSEPLRQAYHAALGQALESRGSDDMVAICQHNLLGAQGQKALPHLDAALTHLVQNCSHERLVKLADRALAAPGLLGDVDRTNTLLRKATSLQTLGRIIDRRPVLDEAIEIASRSGESALQARALLDLGDLLLEMGCFDEASESFHQALRCGEALGDADLMVQALGKLGRVAHRIGKLDEARLFCDREWARARESGDRKLEGRATYDLAVFMRRTGQYKEARPLFEHALEISRELGDWDLTIITTQNLADISQFDGRGDEGLPMYERALALAQERGDRRRELDILHNLGCAYFDHGRYHEAQAVMERTVGLARQMGRTPMEASALVNLGGFLAQEGRYREAGERYEQGVAVVSRIPERPLEAALFHGLGKCHTDLGRWPEARTCFERALAAARAVGSPNLISITFRQMGLLFASMGELDQAISHLEQSLDAAREDAHQRAISLRDFAGLLWSVGAPDARDRILAAGGALPTAGHRAERGWWAEGPRRLGLLSEEQGNTEEAERFFREAVDEARSPEQLLTLLDCLVDLGRNLMQQERFDEARTFLTEAYEAAEAAGLENRAVYATCFLSALPGGDPGAARKLLDSREETLPFSDRMRARFLLWQAGDHPDDLQEAKRLLQYLVDHAPEQYRRSMIENVRPHREIAAAAMPVS